MRFIAGLLLGAALSCAAGLAQDSTTNFITGEWNFSQGDLRATVGAPMQFRGNTATVASFEQATIGGLPARVLRLPALSADQGLIMPHGAAPNGGGANVNVYSLIMDVMWPSESNEQWRALLQSDTNNVEDAVFLVNPANALGINNVYEGSLPPNQWHRIALVFDLPNNTVTKFIHGQTNFVQTLGSSTRDGRFSLGPQALLFSDNDGESHPVLIGSVQFRAAAMSQEEVDALGGATAGGISGSEIPLDDVKFEHIQKVGADVVMTVSGGGSLQLQTSATLAPNSWANLGSAQVTNTFRVPASEAKAFFRIERR